MPNAPLAIAWSGSVITLSVGDPDPSACVSPKASTMVCPVSSVVAISVPPPATKSRSAAFSAGVYEPDRTQPVKSTSTPASVRTFAWRMPGAMSKE